MARGGKRRNQVLRGNTHIDQHHIVPPPAKKAKCTRVPTKHVPVDYAFTSALGNDGDAASAAVLQHDGCIYDAHLHQAFLASRRHATCLLQLVATDYGYYVWQRRTRWHGDEASSKDVTMTELSPRTALMQEAIDLFTQAFEQRAGVRWVDRFDNALRMQPMPSESCGRFCFVAMEYPSASTASLHVRCPPAMHTDVRKLMSLLYKDVECPVLSSRDDDDDDDGVFAMPLPLPYATVAIDFANAILDQVAAALQSKSRGRRGKLQGWSNLYFSAIPHTYPPHNMLDSTTTIENCREMLKELHMSSPTRSLVHHLAPPDFLAQKYAALGVHLQVVPTESLEYDLVATYLDNSKAHVQYKMTIQSVYRINKADEAMAFKPYEVLGNRKLLWHGSTLANWPGILKDGLQIAPPHVASNGHCFGKGIYFSDSVSRSAPYCRVTMEKRTGILLLSEVALGNPNPCTTTNTRAQSAVDFVEYHSVLGVGSFAPSPDGEHVLPDGAVIPIGPLKHHPIGGKRAAHIHVGLDYNEYVIYNPAQTRMRYLVVTDFGFDM
ncbi:hypothetical protein H310_14335 [Aphanomyces invadans]|uniref:Poly [ADP-ribose] polymerase n=1 Tax=Aphanomyces invadans TaxID=157072 RepID=A0A024TCF0_9STRA|nr:hypothetical protein H310_14335 [Aphanomyces invadans]ETV91002.1 hypothetical protein H310_14335 [Aphanomyces invadans]|eukprot:XP_008880391.1 hypothetical protein H310_14335 [Aphanomyces invadans]